MSLFARIRRRLARLIRSGRARVHSIAAGKSGALDMELSESSGDDVAFVRNALHVHNFRTVGDSDHRTLNVLLRDTNNRVVGGLLGRTYWNWLSVDYVWIHPGHRGQKHSVRLFEVAEQEAVRRGCHHAFLDTFSFQDKVGLYQSLGYEVYGVLDDFPPGHRHFFMKKALAASVSKAQAGAGSAEVHPGGVVSRGTEQEFGGTHGAS